MTKFIAHEFTHCVHHIDYFPNNPRWLWEGLAMFESGWFIDPSGIQEIKSKNYPQLSKLANGMEYMLAYVIIEAITSLYGFEQVIALVKSRGNIRKVFAVSEEAFQQRIFQYIHDKYIR